MRFEHYLPSPTLQPLLTGYLEADCRSSLQHSVHTLFPNGLSGIFFNFGDTGKLILEKEYKVAPVSVFGQIDQHFTIGHAPGFYSLGVLFRPTVLAKFLRVNMSEFTNKAVEGELLRADLLELHERLQGEPSIQHKIVLLDEYFCRTLLNLVPAQTFCDEAIHLIDTYENLSISNLADRLRVSQRHLEINFKRSVGISPKCYSRIQRFIRTERKLKVSSALGQRLNIGDEYYDQMHFIKEFKHFTGHTPARYVVENLEMGRSYLVRS